MQLKVNDLYNLSLGLADLSNKELPIDLAFKIQKAQKKVRDELIASDEVRQKIIKKYKEKDLDDGQVQIQKDKIEQYNSEVAELLDQEVKVNIDKISINELKALEKDKIKIKPKTLMQLETILKAD